jgi:hypothetical protein
MAACRTPLCGGAETIDPDLLARLNISVKKKLRKDDIF